MFKIWILPGFSSYLDLLAKVSDLLVHSIRFVESCLSRVMKTSLIPGLEVFSVLVLFEVSICIQMPYKATTSLKDKELGDKKWARLLSNSL